jgi:hypothetical protein
VDACNFAILSIEVSDILTSRTIRLTSERGRGVAVAKHPLTQRSLLNLLPELPFVEHAAKLAGADVPNARRLTHDAGP